MVRLTILLVLGIAAQVSAHGAVTHPPPRQAVDGKIAPWSGAVPAYPIPFDNPNWCVHPDANSEDPRNLTGSNGQACFWFSNGCDIGSSTCDGNSGQPIPCCNKKFVYVGSGDPPPWSDENILVDPTWVKTFNRSAYRPKHIAYPDRKATVCDPRLRTLNTAAECGSRADFWYYAPWRYPGAAPVMDPCGVAGGRYPGTGPGTAGAIFGNTSVAKLADKGTTLPAAPSGTTWTVGTDVEVSWTQKAWHGGGYTYRLCPASSKLTEACFQAHPLDFVGNSSLRWGGVGGEQIFFNTTALGWDTAVTNTTTIPVGSVWRKVPLPRGPWNWAASGPSFEPVCEESDECKKALVHPPKCLGPEKPCFCKCSGDGIGDLPQLEIVDKVHLSADLPAGDYVLGWRWDCEESFQVWNSCSDVTIQAK